ncbi:MAG: endolytic transglycosylase MltG [Clostridium sp.]|jgi:UPF0755 protein|nr:endolytic transglycosylase MltG [Clostridium sp.]
MLGKSVLRLLALLLAMAAFLAACGTQGEAGLESTAATTGSSAETSGSASGTEDKRTSAAAASSESKTTTGDVDEREIKRVVIPEGYSFYQIAATLEENGICGARDFFDAAQNYTVQSFTVPNNPDVAYRYEGFLFPATYELYTDSDPVEVLKKMLNAYYEYSGLPDYDSLILASVIERETRSTEQMAMISSVFNNRIKQGIKLGSDVTAEYVNNYIVQSGTWIKNPDRYRALFNTAWNDDFVGVLPAGPICSPGIRAINAAQNPAKSDYLFFFFGADHQNHYSKTYSEHLAQIEQYGLG